MQGFASELLGEVFTKGKGPFGQIGIASWPALEL